MKKSILFGALAFFAISAMGIQNATAQDVDTQAKKAGSKAITVEKKDASTTTAVKQEPVKEKKADCCAEKKTEVKKADCCAEKKTECKKAESKKADCCAEKKVAKDDAKTVKPDAERKAEREAVRHSGKKAVKKAEKDQKVEK